MEIRCITRQSDQLGESPVWCPRERVLTWIDLRGHLIHRLDPATAMLERWPVAEEVTALVLREEGGAVLALRDGLARFDFRSGALEPWIPAPVHGRDGVRFGDGRCDRAGRLWLASVVEQGDSGRAGLYRIDGDRSVARAFDGLTVGGGLAWSPDAGTLYVAEPWQRTVFAFDFDLDAGAVDNRRVFARFSDQEGAPDGATVDTDGCLWIALYDGWRIGRYGPDGTLLDTLTLPVPRPTGVVFGGADLDTLFVTTAAQGLGAEALRAAPLSGSVFAVRTAARGLPEPCFRG